MLATNILLAALILSIWFIVIQLWQTMRNQITANDNLRNWINEVNKSIKSLKESNIGK